MTETTGLTKPSDIRAKADAIFQQTQEAPAEVTQEVTQDVQTQEETQQEPETGELVEQEVSQPAQEGQPKPKTPYIPKPRVDEMVKKARDEAARELLPQLEQERAKVMALEQYVRQNMQWVQQPKQEAAPDVDASKFLDEDLAKVVFDLKRKNEMLEAKLGQVEQTTTADKTFNRMEQIEADFARSNPDYSQAVQHVIALYPDQTMGAKTVWDIATTALKQNKNPAAELYAFAKKAGFAGEPAELKNSPNLKAIEKNTAKTRSVGDISSDVPSINAPAYDYGKLVGKHGLSDPKKIREQASRVLSRAGNLV